MYRNLLVWMGALVCYLTLGVTSAQAQAPPGAVLVGQKTAVSGPFTITITQYETLFGGQKQYCLNWVARSNGGPTPVPWKGVIHIGNGFNLPYSGGSVTVSLFGPDAPAGLSTIGNAPPSGAITSLSVVADNGGEGSVSYTVKPWP